VLSFFGFCVVSDFVLRASDFLRGGPISLLVIASATPTPFPNPTMTPRRFALHGLAVEVECDVPAVDAEIARILGPFAVSDWPEGFTATSGVVRAYDTAQVTRHVSPTAWPLPPHRSLDLAELYEEEERFWLVDERWGMVEINFLKGSWRSWVLPRPQLDPVRVAEMAVLWPAAQLLRPRGLYLLPAAAAVRNGWAFLLLCPFGLEPELTALVRSGHKLIGQRWTAVREEEGRLALLHLPGRTERPTMPRPKTRFAPRAIPGIAGDADDEAWVDLNGQFPGSTQNHAFCDAVLVAGPGRRARAALNELAPADALSLLRQAWPIAELHPHRRYGPLPARLSQQCRCAQVELSRSPVELLSLLDGFRYGAARASQVA